MVERVKLRPQYEVGYGKPPGHTQFMKGRSGNPKGRPKGSKSLATIIDEEMNQPVTIVENGKRKRVTKMQAVVRQTMNKALRGDPKAGHHFLNMARSRDALKHVRN